MSKVITFSPRKGSQSVQREKLEQGNYVAEFFVNELTNPHVHHYLITRKGSPAILLWGQNYSKERCKEEAKECLNQLVNASSSKAAM